MIFYSVFVEHKQYSIHLNFIEVMEVSAAAISTNETEIIWLDTTMGNWNKWENMFVFFSQTDHLSYYWLGPFWGINPFSRLACCEKKLGLLK